MADEDAGRASDEDDDRAREGDADAGRARDTDADTGFSFSLPPILLPKMRLPERIRLLFPAPDPPEKPSRPTRVRASRVLLVVALADGLDVAVALWAGPGALPWARAAAGTLLSVVLVGFPGLLYAWELLAILVGFGWLSFAPTATALVLVRLLYSR